MKSTLAFLALFAALPAGGISADFASSAPSTGAWANLYSADLPTYAANLRAAGFPEATVGLLVSQEVDARFKEREEALLSSLSSLKSLREQFSAEQREALLQLRVEKNTLLRSVLGSVPAEVPLTQLPSEVLARLSPQERDRVRMTMEDYDLMIRRVINASRGHLLDEDRAKLQFLETERLKDLQKLLSADEILDFELSSTSFGRNLLKSLKLFAPTPEQMRTVLSAAQAAGLDIESMSNNTAHANEARMNMNAELKRRWGPAVYTRYRDTISTQYTQIFTLVERLGLSPNVADEIFASQKSTTETGLALYKQFTGKPESHESPALIPPTGRFDYVATHASNNPARDNLAAGIGALVQAHCELVLTRLGEAGYAEYYDMNRSWIENMQGGGVTRLPYSGD